MSAVARAFDRARDYDAHAHVQGEVAAWLAGHLRALPLPARVLEIGCGTGDLAARMLADRAVPDWLMTDIAPDMLARAQARFAGRWGVRFAVMDGEHPDTAERFDLVCASLAVQWFGDLGAGLGRLFGRVAPGGDLVVTTLAAGTFAEWRAAHRAAGVAAGTPDYPARADLAALRLGGVAPRIVSRDFADRRAGAADFLRSLKAIGAGTPRAGHRPLSPATLRAVARAFEAGGAVTTYDVALLHYRKGAA